MSVYLVREVRYRLMMVWLMGRERESNSGSSCDGEMRL